MRSAASEARILRVLVVSRTTSTARGVRTLLGQDTGVRVQVARSVESAATVLLDSPFDAMIVDDEVWAEDGGLIRSIAQAERPEVAIVLLAPGDQGEAPAVPGDAHGLLPRDALTADRLRACLTAALSKNKSLRRRETMVRWLELDARTDHLTGLYTRRTFEERLNEACHAARTRAEPVAVLATNVVGMGALNEQFGESAGDAALRRIAARVAHATRVCDVAGRIGGDDFAILLPGGDVDLARRIARRITQEVDGANAARDAGEPSVALNFGLASGRRCAGADLLAAAEDQLRRGRPTRYAAQPMIYEDADGPSVA